MIDLIATEEQSSIAEGVGAFLRDALPLERFRAGLGDKTPDRWSDLAEMGAFGIAVPETLGGIGLTVLEDLLVFREFGRHLISPAVLGTRLAACAAAEVGDSALVAALLAGERRAGLATQVVDGWQLLDARPGDLCVAVSADALRVFEADAIVNRRPTAGLDGAVLVARASFEGQPVAFSSDPALVLSAPLLSAGMLCGLLEVTRDMAVEYAKTRKQFGHAIGVFQGVKHPCADMAMAAETAWSQACYAALMLHSGEPDAEFHVATAKLVAGEGALDAARANIQIHGGMGFTDEVDAQLVLKRIHVLHQLFRDPRTIPRALLDMPLNV